jgi:hypothetical protein
VDALLREYELHQSAPAEHPLRSSSNYFDTAAAAKISPEVLVASLGSHSSDLRASCFVNAQLLSALPATLDDATAAALVSAYRAAPAPNARPGVSKADQPKLDSLFKGRRMADEADVTHDWQAILDAAARDNQPILAYRDELYHRLPKGFETFAAAMDDLLVRMNAVVDAKAFVKLVSTDLKEWATTASPPPDQLSALAAAARKLADSKGPQYYVSAYWRESSGSFVWRKSRAGIDTGHELKDLASFLDEQSRQPVLKVDPKDAKAKR